MKQVIYLYYVHFNISYSWFTISDHCMDIFEMFLISRVWEISVWIFQGCEGHGVLWVVEDWRCWEDFNAWLLWFVISYASESLQTSSAILTPMIWMFFVPLPGVEFKYEWIGLNRYTNVLGRHVYSCKYCISMVCWYLLYIIFSFEMLRLCTFYVEHDCLKFKSLIWLPNMFATICI